MLLSFPESSLLGESLRKYDKIVQSILGKGCYLLRTEGGVYPTGSISSTNIFFFELIVMSSLKPGGLSH